MKIKWIPIVFGVPILMALLYYMIFTIDAWSELWGLMSLTFFLSIPFAVGVLTIYLSTLERIQTIGARITLPWLPIAGFFILTVAFSPGRRRLLDHGIAIIPFVFELGGD